LDCVRRIRHAIDLLAVQIEKQMTEPELAAQLPHNSITKAWGFAVVALTSRNIEISPVHKLLCEALPNILVQSRLEVAEVDRELARRAALPKSTRQTPRVG